MQYVIAFVTGGMICALSQILMEKTKMLPGRIMVLLACLGAILGFAGLYEPFSQWAQAGTNVPILGFGNNLWKGVKEMVDKKGFIGIFLGGFKNCAAGLSAALVFSYIASLLCQPKMKKHYQIWKILLYNKWEFFTHELGRANKGRDGVGK